MPTEREVKAAANSAAEKFGRLGYNVLELGGPITVDEGGNEGDERVVFHVTADSDQGYFSLFLGTHREYGELRYFYDIAHLLGSRLDEDEIEAIAGESIDHEDEEAVVDLLTQAGEHIIENTDLSDLWVAKFNLFAYASTSLVRHVQTPKDGFPREFTCRRSIFPYDGGFSLKELDSEIAPVLISGERGKMYVESSLIIDRGDSEPENYFLKAQF